MNVGLIVRYAVRETLGLVVMGTALFWAAGRLDWWPAWATLGATLAWTLATAIVILRSSPALLAERLGRRRGAKRWDTALIGALGMSQLARYVVAGLDHRYGWSMNYPLVAQLAALGVCMLGYSIFVWAMASNPYFSQIVRIQSERGHTVSRDGPYCYVRHPAYLGAILYELASPVLLASSWSLIVGAFGAGLIVLRTALEDRTLQVELNGYADYARHIHHRLVPGVW